MEDIREIFVDTTEKQVAVLGDIFLRRFLNKDNPKLAFCVLTDKRLYLVGKYYHKGLFYRMKEDKQIIDIKDIVSSSITTTRFPFNLLVDVLFVLVWISLSAFLLIVIDLASHTHVGYKIILAFCFVVMILGLLAVPIHYYLKKEKVFEIEYTGGKIAFPEVYYVEKKAAAFQDVLNQVKESVI